MANHSSPILRAPSGVMRSSSSHFADHRFERCFARIDLAARAVDFSRTEPALFFDEQYPPVLDDEHQGGVDLTLPGAPVDR
jgi:hypothetical protein